MGYNQPQQTAEMIMHDKKFNDSIDNLIEIAYGEMNNEFYAGLAKFASALNIDGYKLNERFSYEYMKYVYENESKTISGVMAGTGFKRPTVEAFIKKYKSHQFAISNNNTVNVFKEFIHELKTACLSQEGYRLPKYGTPRGVGLSCHSVFMDCRINDKTYTLPTVLSRLEKCGLIEIDGDYVVYKPQIIQEALRTSEDINRQFANMVNDFATTQVHNMKENEHEKRYFSQRVDSIMVSDQKITLTAKQLNEILRKSNQLCFDQLELNEDSEINPDSDYSFNIGVAQFLFINKREKS